MQRSSVMTITGSASIYWPRSAVSATSTKSIVAEGLRTACCNWSLRVPSNAAGGAQESCVTGRESVTVGAAYGAGAWAERDRSPGALGQEGTATWRSSNVRKVAAARAAGHVGKGAGLLESVGRCSKPVSREQLAQAQYRSFDR